MSIAKTKNPWAATDWNKPGWDLGDEIPRPCDDENWVIKPGSGFTKESKTFRALVERLAGKTSENADLQERIDELEQRLSRQERLIKEIFDPSDLPTYGSFEEWRATSEDAKRFRGKHVAFVAGKGVVASSDSLNGIAEYFEKHGRPEGVIIGFVPGQAAILSTC